MICVLFREGVCGAPFEIDGTLHVFASRPKHMMHGEVPHRALQL